MPWRRLGERFRGLGQPLGALNGGGGDAIAPTVVITSTASIITALATIPITITFSEEVTGFAVGDITVGNGAAGDFATADNIVFTANITPTATGTVTVDIAAGVCQDLAGNDNEATTQFSIVALVGFTGVWNNLSPVYTDAGTTPAVNNDDIVQQINGLAASQNLAQGTLAQRGKLKLNSQNGLPGIALDGSQWYQGAAISEFIGDGHDYTVFQVAKPVTVSTSLGTYGDDSFFACTAGYIGLPCHATNGVRGYGYFTTSGSRFTPYVALTMSATVLLTMYYSSADGLLYLQKNNGTPVSVNVDVPGRPINVLTGNLLLGKSASNPIDMVHYELIIIDSKLADTPRVAINAALISKWGL